MICPPSHNKIFINVVDMGCGASLHKGEHSSETDSSQGGDSHLDFRYFTSPLKAHACKAKIFIHTYSFAHACKACSIYISALIMRLTIWVLWSPTEEPLKLLQSTQYQRQIPGTSPIRVLESTVGSTMMMMNNTGCWPQPMTSTTWKYWCKTLRRSRKLIITRNLVKTT